MLLPQNLHEKGKHMLGLLKERFPNYEILELDEDFWDIVNPFGKENIGVYEEKIYTIVMGEEWRPSLPLRSEYVIHFDAQHRHFDEIEDAFKYIESVMNDEICAVGFSRGEIMRLGGEIASSKLKGLTPDVLLREFRAFNNVLDTTFTIRSFSGKYDMNGRIEKVDGNYTLVQE